MLGHIKSMAGKGIASLRDRGIDLRATTRSDGRLSGLRIQLSADETDIVRGAVVRFVFRGQTFRFFVNDDRDVIQGCHRRGSFYEIEELQIIAEHFNGGCFVDVGANVGNHAIFAAKVLQANRVIAFEPVALAAEILSINVGLNEAHDIVELHRCGLSDQAITARPEWLYNSNLGGSRLIADPFGDIEIRRGDEVLAANRVDFIKIDTEGYEIGVLHGLRETIARDKPILFVEVDNGNVDAFNAFCREMNYSAARDFRRYGSAVNFLVKPN